MKTIEIIGYQRANLGKKASADLRAEGNIPCVLYGKDQQVHFYTPTILFRELLYTPNVYQVDINIEGVMYKGIVQEAQFHPVNEMLLHVDFLILDEAKPVKMSLPIRLTGTAMGQTKGGKLVQKLSRLTVKALPGDMPDFIPVDVTELDLGKNVRVGEIIPEKYTVLNADSQPIAVVE
ncbi:MAG: 50S ribosomal protein L25/general stress protein Ctc, partial [Verrucomicrobia bacterium]|nr:50S ribosomal protein L25/general stress protein Ctc [Cytophagales bacterium]